MSWVWGWSARIRKLSPLITHQYNFSQSVTFNFFPFQTTEMANQLVLVLSILSLLPFLFLKWIWRVKKGGEVIETDKKISSLVMIPWVTFKWEVLERGFSALQLHRYCPGLLSFSSSGLWKVILLFTLFSSSYHMCFHKAFSDSFKNKKTQR